jgi:hypothetical protein
VTEKQRSRRPIFIATLRAARLLTGLSTRKGVIAGGLIGRSVMSSFLSVMIETDVAAINTANPNLHGVSPPT